MELERRKMLERRYQEKGYCLNESRGSARIFAGFSRDPSDSIK